MFKLNLNYLTWCDNWFYMSTSLGCSTQLFDQIQILVLLERYFVDVFNILNQLTLMKEIAIDHVVCQLEVTL